MPWNGLNQPQHSAKPIALRTRRIFPEIPKKNKRWKKKVLYECPSPSNQIIRTNPHRRTCRPSMINCSHTVKERSFHFRDSYTTCHSSSTRSGSCWATNKRTPHGTAKYTKTGTEKSSKPFTSIVSGKSITSCSIAKNTKTSPTIMPVRPSTLTYPSFPSTVNALSR